MKQLSIILVVGVVLVWVIAYHIGKSGWIFKRRICKKEGYTYQSQKQTYAECMDSAFKKSQVCQQQPQAYTGECSIYFREDTRTCADMKNIPQEHPYDTKDLLSGSDIDRY